MTLFDFLTRWRPRTPKGSLERNPDAPRIDARTTPYDHDERRSFAAAGTITLDAFEQINEDR